MKTIYYEINFVEGEDTQKLLEEEGMVFVGAYGTKIENINYVFKKEL